MFIAGEASGDLLAAELVHAIRAELAGLQAEPTADYQPLHASLAPQFFGAGGPRMADAGVDLAFDLTAHAVLGLSEAIKNFLKFQRLFRQLFRLAREREPDAIVCVDFQWFNHRFAHTIQRYVRARRDWFHDWRPKLVQYVSPQVWASREGRVYGLAQDYDLLLSILPFEKEWYAKRVPQLRVEFVGHPLVDRYPRSAVGRTAETAVPAGTRKRIVLLPGSRRGELDRHLSLLILAAQRIAAAQPADFKMVLPNSALAEHARARADRTIEVQVGGLETALAEADLAITKSGTITSECAIFGVPAVVFYKTSPVTYLVARRLVKVKYLAMPNLLAKEQIFPEFVQSAATPENIARAALELLLDDARRARVKAKLQELTAALGGPGASRRAARAIVSLVEPGTLWLAPRDVPVPAGE
jgi:lipid-A-disaccharide synthase